MDTVYMDYGSASPVDPRVIEAMNEYFRGSPGNPSSVNSGGRTARLAVSNASNELAALIGAGDRGNIIFTSGATEANNLGVIGAALRGKNEGNRIIISAIEHMSVINAARSLARQGFEVATVPVDSHGTLNIERLRDELEGGAALVSIMYANGEIGTIQPISEIGALAGERGVPLHVDATAAAGKIPINVERDNISLLTVSSNDLYGPQGAGALYIAPRAKIQPIILGGGQQRGLRSGTENIAGIAGFGKACELARIEMEAESARLAETRDRLLNGVTEKIKRARVTGHRENRLPHHASFRFDYVEGESIVLNLDMEGIMASTGSACSRKTLEPSHVLIALGLTHEEAHGSLVMTLGRWTTEKDVEKVLDALPTALERLRRMSPLAPRKEE